MKIKQILLSLIILAFAASPAWAATYSVNCPRGYTAFALQVYNSTNSAPLPGGEDLNTVLPNFNAGGALDGCSVYIPVIRTGVFRGFTAYTVDSGWPTGWGNAADSAAVPAPTMRLGDGAFLNNNTIGTTTLTFSGNVLSVEPPVTLAADTWYLRGRQVPATVSCASPAASWQDLMQSSPPPFPEIVLAGNIGPSPSADTAYFWSGTAWNPSSTGFCLAIGQPVWIGSSSGQFPARGDDNVQSIGQFSIVVNPAFQAMMAGYSGYNATTKTFTSPVLYDGSTDIGRSDPLHKGSAADINGVPVGAAGANVSDSMLVVEPGGLEPVGTREVHTMIYSLDMTGGGAAVRAGIHAPDQPVSAGEVESYSGAMGSPTNDFIAQSFFDVFVDVDLPAGGTNTTPFPGATLYNSMPLIVQNTFLLSFPPQLVYIHGMSTAVPIKFRTGGSFWSAGDTFGLLTLAGHGVFTNGGPIARETLAQATAQLQSALAATPPTPVEPAYASWAPGLTVAGTNMIFPPQGDDQTTSLGTFVLAVNPLFQPYLAGYPGWDPVTKRLQPVLPLFDPATKIGRSNPLQADSPADRNGVPVGTANTQVSDANFTLIPPLYESPSNTFEVHAEMRSLNLYGGGLTMRAGTAAAGSPGSYGEIESLAGAVGDPYWDFPAKGFFDLFVVMDFPQSGAIPAFTVTNTKPLVIQNNNLTNFPPKVVYVHGNRTAVPVAFTTAVPALNNAHAGDIFGVLLFVGHGVGFSFTNSADMQNIQQAVAQTTEEPVDPQYATWASGLNVPLQFSVIAKTNGLLQFNGYCTASNSVTLQSADALINPAWVNVTTITGTSNGTFSAATTKPNVNQKFYRMVDNTR